MDRNDFRHKWNEIKSKIRGKWNRFTDSDISDINGDYDRLMDKFHKRYGYSKDQAMREFQNWHSEGHGGEYGHKDNREGRGNREEGSMNRDRIHQNPMSQDPWEGKMGHREGNGGNRNEQGPKEHFWKNQHDPKSQGHGKQEKKGGHGWDDQGKDKKRKAG